MFTGHGLRNKVIMSKYMHNQSLFSWVRNLELHNRGTSLIWNSFIKFYHWISQSLRWKVGSGEAIGLGIDHFLGMELDYLISPALISFLNSQDIWNLSQVRNCGGVVFSDEY